MSRAVKEWVGKTDDSMPPPRVRLRIFLRDEGRCHRTGRKITPADKWALDHIEAIINGGQNRESNLAPILVDAHKEKTREDLAIKSRTARRSKKHLGIRTAPTRPIKSAPFRPTAKTVKRRRAASQKRKLDEFRDAAVAERQAGWRS